MQHSSMLSLFDLNGMKPYVSLVTFVFTLLFHGRTAPLKGVYWDGYQSIPNVQDAWDFFTFQLLLPVHVLSERGA